MTATPPYAELQATSNFSFLRGAAHPEEMVTTAAELGHRAIAIADRNSLAGIVRAHVAAKSAGIRLVVGARLVLEDAPEMLCFPKDRAAYGRLSRLLTLGKRRAPKGECDLGKRDLFGHDGFEHGEGQIIVVLAPPISTGTIDAGFAKALGEIAGNFPGRCHLAAQHLYRGDDSRRLRRLADLAAAHRVPLVATNDAHAHIAARRPLHDVLTCIREHRTLDTAGRRLFANAERHLKPPEEMARLFADYPEALRQSVAIAESCGFSLDELRYEYPAEAGADGRSPQEILTRLAWEGARARFPAGVPDDLAGLITHELDLIGQLGYAAYFLTVHDIVRFARSRGILCQGRGSAANSAICYCLGITAVDPARLGLLFERFISAARGEPPDIDVDFEHERREEVIQYIYRKYGRERAGLAATVITYRRKSAIRETGKALGLSADTVAALAGTGRWGWGRRDGPADAEIRELGLDPSDRRLALALRLAKELTGFPRHLSQHVGGFVITRGPLSEVTPIANAAMDDRTTVEWDKDDLDALGILKVDILGLGMLTCIRKGLDLIRRHHGENIDLASVPAEDPKVYDMLCQADSIGVFQVESRAQMSMLPRLRPRGFYDLVIEVAIVRPGPIQGDMVHPYLRRRNGEEPTDYPLAALRPILEKTLGIPLFQEQAMRIAITGAGFSPSEADALRRAMATFRRNGQVHRFRDKFITGMTANGAGADFAERCFKQIEGFGNYGFPESHAASFALLVYVSAWIKCHYPAIFACALLNSQPMGFYAPAQIVRDAREHGVEVLPPDVNISDWDNSLEPAPLEPGINSIALRLGLRQIKGLAEADAQKLADGRGNGYADLYALWQRAGLRPATLTRLAEADAYGSLGLSRRQALWEAKRLGAPPPPLFAAAGIEDLIVEPRATLPEMRLGEAVIEDYTTLRLSLKAHPVALLRPSLGAGGYQPTASLAQRDNGGQAAIAGLVLVRQRPGTASGVIFMTIEDETGTANLIVWSRVFERFRRIVVGARLIGVIGRVQREGIVIHVIAHRLIDLSDQLDHLAERDMPGIVPTPGIGSGHRARRRRFPSRDFH